MRILLIDNHDSFTRNLLQLLRATPGTAVDVLRNDAQLPPDWATRFDAAVISPGPGHPAIDADVGISRHVLEHSDLPVLGVCLGHQLLAVLHGCPVERSSHPMHGEVSAIEHTGDALFHDIPTEFTAVRYHSLEVRSTRPPLEPIAYADDGTLMAVRVAGRPRWGVQFHPESIESAYGVQLVGNFLRAARAARHGGERRLPARQRSVPVAAARTLDVVLDALDAAPRLVLDGVETAAGRATVVGWDSRWSEQVRGDEDGTTITYGDGRTETVAPSVLDTLHRRLGGRSGSGVLGYAGFLGYETGFELLGLDAPAQHDDGWPGAWWTLVTRAVLVGAGGACQVAGLDDPDDSESVADLDAWLADTAARLERAAAAAPFVPPKTSPATASSATRPPDVVPEHEHDEYLRLIADCQDAIARGESYELCLTNRLRGTFTGDPLRLFRTLRADGRVPRAAYLRVDDERAVVSGSPELFLTVDGEGHARTEPIKGTRPATGDAAVDDAAAQELAAARKDRAENLMIVDLMRNDFNRIAVPGSTTVTGLYDVRRFPTVLQLVSTVECDLPAGAGVVDLLRVTFPPGSMTGAPKERSVRILGALEGSPRGVYAGTIGLLGLDGTATLSVAIRTVRLTGDRFVIGVGGAITRLSDPEAEWQETLDKAQSTLRAMAAAPVPAERRAGVPSVEPASPDRQDTNGLTGHEY